MPHDMDRIVRPDSVRGNNPAGCHPQGSVRIPLVRGDLKGLSRIDLAAAVADDADPTAVPLPVHMRLPYERVSRWVVIDARRLPAP